MKRHCIHLKFIEYFLFCYRSSAVSHELIPTTLVKTHVTTLYGSFMVKYFFWKDNDKRIPAWTSIYAPQLIHSMQWQYYNRSYVMWKESCKECKNCRDYAKKCIFYPFETSENGTTFWYIKTEYLHTGYYPKNYL